jgi:hypothetical protein
MNATTELLRTLKRSAEKLFANTEIGASIARRKSVSESALLRGVYKFDCIGPVETFRAEYVRLRDMLERELRDDPSELNLTAESLRLKLAEIPMEVKWEAVMAPNLITTAGKNDLWDKYLAGSSYTAAWYMGLVDNSGFSAYAAGDTSSSHSGWTESTAYSNSTRPAVSWNAASSGSKASTSTSFTINASATLDGAFLISNSTKGGTTGVLFSAGAFSGGDRTVASGDTLNITYTASA